MTKTDEHHVEHVPAADVALVERLDVMAPGWAKMPKVVQTFMRAAVQEVSDDPDAAAIQIMAEILSGTTTDEILGNAGTIEAANVLNERLALHGLRFNPSSKPGRLRFYAMLDVTYADKPDEHVLVSCGSLNVMAQAWRMRELGLLPVDVRITEGETTAAGGKPMRLVAAGDDDF